MHPPLHLLQGDNLDTEGDRHPSVVFGCCREGESASGCIWLQTAISSRLSSLALPSSAFPAQLEEGKGGAGTSQEGWLYFEGTSHLPSRKPRDAEAVEQGNHSCLSDPDAGTRAGPATFTCSLVHSEYECTVTLQIQQLGDVPALWVLRLRPLKLISCK